MATDKRNKPRRPSNPYRSFPLTAHNNGQWHKKTCGKIHFFGVWADPQTALDNYHILAADLQAGRQRSKRLPSEAASVKDISNQAAIPQPSMLVCLGAGVARFFGCRQVRRADSKPSGGPRAHGGGPPAYGTQAGRPVRPNCRGIQVGTSCGPAHVWYNSAATRRETCSMLTRRRSCGFKSRQ